MRNLHKYLKQSSFYWKPVHKFQELWNFKLEVTNIFMTSNYNVQDKEKVPTMLNWLGIVQLQFQQPVNNEEKENVKLAWTIQIDGQKI